MNYLQRVERLLDLTPGEKADVLRELGCHLEDVREELMHSGMDAEQAEAEAEKRMGLPGDVAARISAAHNVASWKSAILLASPFFVSVLVMMCAIHQPMWLRLCALAVVGLITSVVSVRELILGRRPIWLSTWLAAALLCAAGLIEWAMTTQMGKSVMVARMVYVVGFEAITLIVALCTRRWRALTGILSAIVALCICVMLVSGLNGSTNFFIAALPWVLLFVFLVLFARIVFESHPYGNAMRASLFLLPMFALKYPVPVLLHDGYYMLVAALAIGGIMLWIARAQNQQSKLRALNTAILPLAAAMASLVPGVSSCWSVGIVSFAFGVGVYWGLLEQLIIWPIRAQEAARRGQQNPPVAVE